MANAHGDELLEALRQQAGCLYLSDLHTPACRKRLYRALAAIDARAHSAEAWRDAARYISGRQPQGHDAESVKNWLRASLADE